MPAHLLRLRGLVQGVGFRLFAGMVLLALLGACSGLPEVHRPSVDGATAAPQHRIYVVSHGWHTGLILPAAALDREIPDLRSRFGTPDFYEIGWGDKGFYQADEVTAGLALQAMFWSPGTVLHVVGLPGDPARYFGNSEILDTCLNEQQLDSLTAFIAASFARNTEGRVISLRPGIYGDSQFYDGVGYYQMFNTCNTWTAKGLASAGVDISPFLKLTSASIMDSLRQHQRSCAAVVAQ